MPEQPVPPPAPPVTPTPVEVAPAPEVYVSPQIPEVVPEVQPQIEDTPPQHDIGHPINVVAGEEQVRPQQPEEVPTATDNVLPFTGSKTIWIVATGALLLGLGCTGRYLTRPRPLR